jgi:hypothetical protein
MSTVMTIPNTARKKGSPFFYFLMAVMALFIGILIFCYIVTKRAHPVFLDEHGRPTNALPAEHHDGHGR